MRRLAASRLAPVRLAILLAFGVPLVACQATTHVDLMVRRDGSGTLGVSLVLDRQAAVRLAGTAAAAGGRPPGGDVGAGVASALGVDDLLAVGWRLAPVTTAGDGSVTATLEHAFASPAEADALLRQLSSPTPRAPQTPAPTSGPTPAPATGADAVPVALAVTRRAGLVSSEITVLGSVDLGQGVDAFADSGIDRSLGVPSLADALGALRAAGGTVPDLRVALSVHLAGRPVHLSSGASVSGHTVTWEVALGETRRIAASARSTDLANGYVPAGFALAAATLVAFIVVERRRRDQRALVERRRRDEGGPHPPA